MNELHSETLNIGELDVHYLTGGQGSPLVVVHGGTGGARDWYKNLEKLTDIYTVYVPDMPGFGLTKPLKGDYHIPQATDFLERFTQKLVIRTPKSGPKDTVIFQHAKMSGKELSHEEIAVYSGASHLRS